MQLIKKRLLALPDRREAFELTKVFESLFSTQSLGSAGVAFTTSTWQTTNPVPYLINNVLAIKAAVAAQAVPASLTFPGTALTFNAGAFLIALDGAGNVVTFVTAVTASTASNALVAAANTLSSIVWPIVPEIYCVIGAIVIQSTTAATAFVPGTTALNAAGITSTFINTTGPFFPAIA